MIRSAKTLAIFFLAIASIGVGVLLFSFRPNEVTVLTPVRDIRAYESVNPNTDFREIKVRENKVKDMAKYELTSKWLEDAIKDAKKDKDTIVIYTTTPLYVNGRIDNRVLSVNQQGSLSIVLPSERVISMSVTLESSAAAIPQPGDIVSIASDEAEEVEFAKVIALGIGTNVRNDVTGRGNSSEEAAAGGLIALLAVDKEVAGNLSGKSANLVYNPFCKVEDDGSIVPVDKEGAEEACKGANAAGGAEDPATEEPTDETTEEEIPAP